MSDILPGDLDLQTIGIIALCFAVGFFIAWTWLGARSDSSKKIGGSRSEARSKGEAADQVVRRIKDR